MTLDQEIIRRIRRHPRGSAGYKQLIRELGLRGGSERRELEERLKKMVRRGELTLIGRDRYGLPGTATDKGLVAGRLHMHRDGYGFVSPEDKELKARIAGDIYIAPKDTGNAMHGDRVLVETGPIRSDGRAEGRIIKVSNRAHSTVVGIFHYGSRYNHVSPIDDKITQEIFIPPGGEIAPQPGADGPGAPAAGTPHRVLGTEAKRSQIVDLEGVVVNVEITQFPTATQQARGRILEMIGYEDDFGVDVEIMIRKHHLPHVFPPEVLEAARGVSGEIPAAETARRRDWRHLPIVTIDGETARDFDDAVLVDRLPNGNYQLQVHIADVAHFVAEGDPMDYEARLRGTSTYFPDRAIPMLPLELSTGICSLRPREDRLVLSCLMEIDHAGEIQSYELSEGVIRSAERMTYTAVQGILNGDPALRRHYDALGERFERMAELAAILNRKRVKRGSIDFDMPEPNIEFDEQGLMRGITRSERNTAHRLIEEFMLAANECVASHLERSKIASLYRIHEKPDARKVYDFEVLAASFGYSLGVGALPIQRMQMKADRRSHRDSGRNIREIEIPGDVHVTPRMYQKLTAKIAGKPEERILSYLMLRSLKQARYSEVNEGHFALAASSYTHFTSPIRRYPDLIVHRILKDELTKSGGLTGEQLPGSQMRVENKKLEAGSHGSPWSKRRPRGSEEHAELLGGPLAPDELHEIAEESSLAERRADEAERELLEWKKIRFMEGKLGEEFPALIISVTKFGMFVELLELFIEGLVPLATMQGDRYTYRENTRQIIGERSKQQYSVGGAVRVLLDRIDPVQKKLQFALVEPEPPSGRKRPRSRGR